MGMFDYIRCEQPMPEGAPDVFQTKDLDCMMDSYTITADGRLIKHQVRYEIVPEEERPYYNTPKWGNPMYTMCGSVKSIPIGDWDTNFHGDVQFYAMSRGRWWDFVALFKDGQLIDLRGGQRDEVNSEATD